jgi:hypothetical protein
METLFRAAKECYSNLDKPLHHKLRSALEPILFDSLRETYGKTLKEFWDNETFPKVTETQNTVLMVERRIHPNLEFCLQNFMYFTRNKNFSLTIVCSKENEGQIRNILGKHIETTDLRVMWENNPTDMIGKEQNNSDQSRWGQAITEYNALFQNPEFWSSINADFILSVQTDCYLRKPLPDLLWDIDYAASPWAWKPWVVGGSGLTFRRKEAVIDMCKRVFMKGKKVAEDEFFAHMCIVAKKKVLPLEIAETIFSESRIVDDPVGVHQWWTYLFQGDLNSEKEFIEKHCRIYMTLNIKQS